MRARTAVVVASELRGPGAPPDALFELIREGKGRRGDFFGANIANRTQIANVIAELQDAARHAVLPRPLRRPWLMMTDRPASRGRSSGASSAGGSASGA